MVDEKFASSTAKLPLPSVTSESLLRTVVAPDETPLEVVKQSRTGRGGNNKRPLGFIDRDLTAQFGDRSSILPVAISDRDGTSSFILNPKNRGNCRIAEGDGYQDTIKVETRTASALAKDGHLGDQYC
jgi:hypothetical protein